MDEKRAKNILTAFLSSGVLLLIVLVSVLVYQYALMGKTRAKINDLKQEIEVLEDQNAETQDDIDIWLNEWKITERANELGYLYGEDK